eukprot:TRINITY_DN9749_c0_g4_i1.p2 TRINITY_DN9749_c0_g4~~TRINITY_DN9749_c0_g4_i1.p2  ORF type:complete len:505 (+),score=185.39 TRINITY_DN9749_c0_g4_i1:78-1592(+)
MAYRGGGGGGAFNARRGDVVDGRYRVASEAGAGNFARVVRAQDTQRGGEMVAVKMLRREYQRDAAFEREVLQAINQKDPDGRHKVAHMTSYFQWQGMPCFTFRLYGPALKSRRFGGVGRKQLANLARQLARTLHFFHFECRLVHTDLKPENILCDDLEPQAADGIGAGWTICDLGSASFFGPKPDQDLISTRPYRAPEVVLGCPWSYAADMWSLGCILYEVARGRKLFDVTTDAQHLQLFQRRLGPVPLWLVRNAESRRRSQLFDSQGRLLQQQRSVSAPPLDEELREDPEFLDLLEQCFQYDPAARLRADEVAHHPFVTRNTTPPPGGAAPLVTRLPANGYSSGAIRTPGAEYMRDCVPLSAARKEQLRLGAPGGKIVATGPVLRQAADCVPADSIPPPPIRAYTTTHRRPEERVSSSALAAAEAALRSARSESKMRAAMASPAHSGQADGMYQTSSQAYGSMAAAMSGRRGSAASASEFPALHHQTAAGIHSRRADGHGRML